MRLETLYKEFIERMDFVRPFVCRFCDWILDSFQQIVLAQFPPRHTVFVNFAQKLLEAIKRIVFQVPTAFKIRLKCPL